MDTAQKQLERALEIALEVHRGQHDKAGAAYILHPLRVMLRMKDDAGRLVGVLHDVIEDSRDKPAPADRWDEDRLRREGFPEPVVEAVGLLTKPVDADGKEMDYDTYVARLQHNPLARRVKLADLTDNMDESRLKDRSEKSLNRLAKYRKHYDQLAQLEMARPSDSDEIE
jgi:(p)ppGpp synthase/HD superfamily hydrolase